MTQGSESSSIIHPTLHHFGVETRHPEKMVEWYAKVVGMVTMCSTANARGSEAGVSMSANFVDADKLVAARQAGMSFAELHRRAYAGEFPPSRPMNPRDLM